jgi:hypothetical protein
MYSLTVLTVLVFLPLIPAILLFKGLRSRAGSGKDAENDAENKLEGQIAPGLKVSLSGAFAGYVALLVFLATVFARLPHTTTWHVRGDLQFPNGTPSVVSCEVHPPEFNRLGENGFNLDLPIAEGGAPPSIVISAKGYETRTIDLTDEKGNIGGEFDARKNEETQMIRVNKPIVFKPASDYPMKIAEGGRQ